MQRSFEVEARARLLGWGPFVTLPALGGGPFQINLTAESKSDAPSSFDGELHYFGEDAARRQRRFLCPGSVSVITEANT